MSWLFKGFVSMTTRLAKTIEFCLYIAESMVCLALGHDWGDLYLIGRSANQRYYHFCVRCGKAEPESK